MNFIDLKIKEFEEYANLTLVNDKIDMEVNQLSRGQYRCNFSILTLNRVILSRRHFHNKVLHTGISSDDYVFFAFTKSTTPFFVNGKNISSRNLYCFFKNEEICSIMSEGTVAYSLGIKTSSLKHYLEEDVYLKLEELMQLIKYKPISELVVKRTTDEAIKTIEQALMLRPLPTTCTASDIEETLILMIAELLNQYSKVKKLKLSINTRLTTFFRAAEFIANSKLQSPTIAQIANAAFVSVRTLEYAFASVCGISPKKYLAITRLNLIKTQLQQASNKHSITAILQSYCVVNTGRFAKEYFQMFGEYPKDTIRK